MKSFADRNPYAVGLVSVLVVGALTGFAFALGVFHLLENTYTIKAEFADAAGLKVDDEVRLAGVRVGRVSDVDVEREQGRIIVSMAVDSGVDVRDEATAEISLATLLGSKYVRLDDAEVGDELLDGYCDDVDADADDELPVDCDDGGRPMIRFERAGERIPFDIFNLTRIATEGVQELDTDAVNDLVTQLADVTEGRRESLTTLIETIDDVSLAITTRDQQLGELLARADTLSTTLAEKDETLVALVDQSRAILALLDQRRSQLAAALGEGAEAVTGLADLIAANKGALDRLLTNLHPTIEVVQRNFEALNRSLAWAGPGLYNQALAGSHGHWLDIFIRGLGPDIGAVLCDLLAPTGECQGGQA